MSSVREGENEPVFAVILLLRSKSPIAAFQCGDRQCQYRFGFSSFRNRYYLYLQFRPVFRDLCGGHGYKGQYHKY